MKRREKWKEKRGGVKRKRGGCPRATKLGAVTARQRHANPKKEGKRFACSAAGGGTGMRTHNSLCCAAALLVVAEATGSGSRTLTTPRRRIGASTSI